MAKSYDKKQLIAVFPPVGGGRLRSPALRRWLARADLRRESGERELLSIVLGEIGVSCPTEGLAALRMWGQTGDKPTAWLAAADPVYLEPRLDHLCLHALRRGGIASVEMGMLFDHLQDTLCDGTEFGFARLGTYGYLRAGEGIATAEVPPYVVDGRKPDDFMPQGAGSGAHRQLVSEIEMALHEHAVNRIRAGKGLQPINSLWIWGGGRAPRTKKRALPVLYADDPLLAGFWKSSHADAYRWPNSLDGCLEGPEQSVVAVAPEFVEGTEFLEHGLSALQKAFAAGRLAGATVAFRDGVRADFKRAHLLRFWRRDSGAFE